MYSSSALHTTPGPNAGQVSVSHIRRLSQEEFRDTPRSFHCHEDFMELALCVGGTTLVIIDGRSYIASEGDLIIHNRRSYHQECADQSNQFSLYVIALKDVDLPGLERNCIAHPDASKVIPTGECYPLFRTLFERIMHLACTDDLPDPALLSHYVNALLLESMVFCEPKDICGACPSSGKDLLTEQIYTYLENHYTEKLTLQSIGEALCLSADYVSHLFKEAYGYAPMQYVNALRIGEAQLKLIETNEKISDIAMDVGFNNIGNFNRAFFLFSGDSPREFRKKHVFR